MVIGVNSIYPYKRIFGIPSALVLELFRIVWYFGIGSMYSLLITEIAKFNIGRLRPHFITLLIEKCYFTLTDDICTDNGFTKMVNLTEVLENCPQPLEDEVADGMKSFSSGMFLKIDTLLHVGISDKFPLSGVQGAGV